MRSVRAKNIPLLLAMCEKRHSNQSLAKAAGISPGHFSKILNQRFSPTEYTRARIANALDVPERQIFPEVSP
jgi:transcriptional regulator with XRE-family HTH domain